MGSDYSFEGPLRDQRYIQQLRGALIDFQRWLRHEIAEGTWTREQYEALEEARKAFRRSVRITEDAWGCAIGTKHTFDLITEDA